MRRSWSMAALILALVAPRGPDGAAQVLDLDAADGPPALGRDTVAARSSLASTAPRARAPWPSSCCWES